MTPYSEVTIQNWNDGRPYPPAAKFDCIVIGRGGLWSQSYKNRIRIYPYPGYILDLVYYSKYRDCSIHFIFFLINLFCAKLQDCVIITVIFKKL